MASGRKKTGVLSTVINLFGVLTALVMIIRMLLVLSGSTADNPLFTVVRTWSDLLVLWWGNIIKPAGAPASVIITYALAAAFWLLVTRVLARVLK
ncbi:hypothetical protein [Kutzneria sp. CA-103260]|uniref:hypothetical protein n=1 Tax=Kutzneria sp. CA-103260 TaxID=2802641 RepID=UPI001BA9CC97|nr:hypothetical protein [Kutzneria sp. CA-103260]QUQ69764.1 hypothetical protein JJ691_75260 [Kutzneria sp. CA-103260]